MLLKRRIIGIKFRLIALGVGMCLGGVALRHFVALPAIQGHIQELVATQQTSTARLAARGVEHQVAARLAMIERVGRDLPLALLAQPEALGAWLNQRQHIYPLFNGGMVVFDPAGKMLASTAEAANTRVGIGPAWLDAPSATPAAVRGPALALDDGRLGLIPFSVAIRSDTGGIVAVLSGLGRLDRPGFLDNMLPDQDKSPTGLLLISPAERVFLAASDPAMQLRPTPAMGINPLHDRAMQGFRGTGLTTNAKGIDELSAIVPVAGTDWFVVARIPAEIAFAGISDVRAFMIKASIAALIFLLLVLAVGVSHILKPLVSAARAIRDMASGKRELAALPVVREDEVGQLIGVFNVLVKRLHNEEAARRASDALLLHMAHHDSLTGLCNRAMLENRLALELARCERNGSGMALMFCDLDGFKAINDAHGHHVGDAVLREVAMRLSARRRQVDTVARLGGDEFVILLSDLADARNAAAVVAAQCMESMRRGFAVEELQLSLGVSIGIVVHHGSALPAAQLLSRADAAMYEAKRQGKGRFVFLD